VSIKDFDSSQYREDVNIYEIRGIIKSPTEIEFCEGTPLSNDFGNNCFKPLRFRTL